MAANTHMLPDFAEDSMICLTTKLLPVFRSPMINSRWPLPTGIIKSIIIMPVTNCRSIFFLPTMPVGTTSTGRKLPTVPFVFTRLAQFSPNASKVLPTTSSPTCTPNTEPDLATLIPTTTNSRASTSTSNSDSFNAVTMPNWPCSNLTISPNDAPGRPSTWTTQLLIRDTNPTSPVALNSPSKSPLTVILLPILIQPSRQALIC